MDWPLEDAAAIVYGVPAAAWLALAFAVGAAFGSFFNVVAYRLPRGMPLSRPASRCPACGRPIRPYDNVPIFGWLWLGGRCRDCRAPIAPRYPLVELIVALATALVAASALGPEIDDESTVSFFPLLFVFRLAPVYVLLCAALMELDGHPLPPKLETALWGVLIVGVAAVLLWPPLLPPGAPAWQPDERTAPLAALAAGLLLAGLAWPALVDRGDPRGIRSALGRAVELLLVAAVLGAAAATLATVFALLVLVAGRLVSRNRAQPVRFGWASALAAATLMGIVADESLACWPRLLCATETTALVAGGVLVAVLAVAARLSGRGATRR